MMITMNMVMAKHYDMENEIPWAEEQFGLISMQRDREAEEDDDGEDVVYEPGQYTEDEKTDWFKAKVKPVHAGLYEVKTKEWPFPHTMEWTEKGWCLRDTKTTPSTKVTDWRGLKTNV